jgi:hypothetical protein
VKKSIASLLIVAIVQFSHPVSAAVDPNGKSVVSILSETSDPGDSEPPISNDDVIPIVGSWSYVSSVVQPSFYPIGFANAFDEIATIDFVDSFGNYFELKANLSQAMQTSIFTEAS